jgi:hypothetical protein
LGNASEDNNVLLASSIPDWIQAVASLASLLLAALAVSLARMGLRHSHEAVTIASDAAGLERQKVLGSAIGLTDVTGFTAGNGEVGVIVAFADFIRPSRQPRLLEVRLESGDREPFGIVQTPFFFVEQGSENLCPAASLIVPTDQAGALGVFFTFGTEQQGQLRSAANDQGLGNSAVTLPAGTVLRAVVQDPLGQHEYVFNIDQWAFPFVVDSAD